MVVHHDDGGSPGGSGGGDAIHVAWVKIVILLAERVVNAAGCVVL
jgi:hypothetical protein